MAVTICMSAWLSPSAWGSPRILIIGDSLTEGYNLTEQEAYPAKLEAIMKKSGHPTAKVVNAGTSGATSAFGLRTLRFQSKFYKPDYLILALGANDGLRGVKPHETQKNLALVIEKAQSLKIKVILVGMEAPPNYGRDFPKEFRKIYPKLADTYKVNFIPFLLEGVAGEPHLNLPDGIHPNAKGYDKIAEHLWNTLKEIIHEKPNSSN